jgi:outer membrane protein assembly factor BamB
LANGTAPQADPPVEWSETKNVRWKVEIPGEGTATPIIWDDRVFIAAAVRTDRTTNDVLPPSEQPKGQFGITQPNHYYQFTLLCLDRATGKTLWKQVATEQVPHEGHHPDNTFASASPVTDGKHVYVSFGSQGIYCYDMQGNQKWKRDLGKMKIKVSFGEGSSPVLHGDYLITVFDHEAGSFIIALDAATGETRWKTERDEKTSWATPLVVENDGRAQIVTNASAKVRSYDLETGKLLWECGGQVGNVTPSPVSFDSMVICMSGFRGSALYALPLDEKGDLTDSDKILYTKARGTPYIPSPLLYKGRLYYTQSNDAILTSLDAKTGEPVIERKRLPGLRNLYASPVAADGQIYITGRDGTTLVIAHADELKVLATNKLDDRIDASPALVGKEIFLRGKKFLYCVAEGTGE